MNSTSDTQQAIIQTEHKPSVFIRYRNSFLLGALLLTLIIATVILRYGFGFLPEPVVSPTIATPTTTQEYWQTYTDPQRMYSFQYPNTWHITSGYAKLTLQHEDNGETWQLNVDFFSKQQLSTMGITYCANAMTIPTDLLPSGSDIQRCQVYKTKNINAVIDWGADAKTQAFVEIQHPNGGVVTMQLTPINVSTKKVLFKMLSTFILLDTNISPTCKPRPACLDATPHCMIPETPDMCPKVIPTPTVSAGICTQEAKLCPDGKTYVGRTGPDCEFAACPQ